MLNTILMIAAFVFAIFAAFSIPARFGIQWGWLAIATWLLAIILPLLAGANLLIVLLVVVIILIVILIIKLSPHA